MCATSAMLCAHHLFAVWNGDRRLKEKVTYYRTLKNHYRKMITKFYITKTSTNCLNSLRVIVLLIIHENHLWEHHTVCLNRSYKLMGCAVMYSIFSDCWLPYSSLFSGERRPSCWRRAHLWYHSLRLSRANSSFQQTIIKSSSACLTSQL